MKYEQFLFYAIFAVCGLVLVNADATNSSDATNAPAIASTTMQNPLPSTQVAPPGKDAPATVESVTQASLDNSTTSMTMVYPKADTTTAPTNTTAKSDNTTTTTPASTTTITTEPPTTETPTTKPTPVPPTTPPTTTKPTSTTPDPKTTTVSPSPTPSNTTTVKPSPEPTTPSPPKPVPCHRFDGPSFIGGIVLTVGLLAISFVAYKFYKARNERNYHTL